MSAAQDIADAEAFKRLGSMKAVLEESRRAYLADDVTLNGKPAIICGASNEFATVKAIASAEQAEFSWKAVERIKARGGNFKA